MNYGLIKSADNKMAAMKRRSKRRHTSQPQEAPTGFDNAESVCDVVGNYQGGRRRSARLRRKVAAQGGKVEGCVRIGKRARKSQQRIVTDGPAKKISKIAKQLSGSQRILDNDETAGRCAFMAHSYTECMYCC